LGPDLNTKELYVAASFAADNYATATVGRDGVDVLATVTVPPGSTATSPPTPTRLTGCTASVPIPTPRPTG